MLVGPRSFPPRQGQGQERVEAWDYRDAGGGGRGAGMRPEAANHLQPMMPYQSEGEPQSKRNERDGVISADITKRASRNVVSSLE